MNKCKYEIFITSDYDYFCDDWERALDNNAVCVHITAGDVKELLWFMEKLIIEPLGMWYWVVDNEANDCMLCGAIDPEDIKIFEE